MGEVEAKAALVVGGGSGIGRAVALALAREGARVAIADLNGEGAARVAEEAREVGAEAVGLFMDVRRKESVAQGVKAALEALGGLDILVNAAGIDRIAPFWETDEDLWDALIAVNYKGVLHACRQALPPMMAQGRGAIVNIASDAGRVGSSGEAVYSGTKGAVIAFTKALAREVARHGIRVNAVAPGPTDTPLLHALRQGHEGLFEAMVRATPLRRLARPEEVAEVVVFLASDQAGFVTGQVVSVSGGLTMC
ncbi:2-hydroxycyclohexanecarboxyl-CoA dehydrogenase [Thermus sp. 2.9]|uniref:SDR family NAD(P)-dependent oxidoreductase n=1 Tax=Thermus sp. (strain 2.9) TaxID=1577051 RepID=UPI000542E1F6|nr:SDR family NAD(P)-dependent oxidoreductase [Thermus sp. 2.9]KHG65498.1 2-hydroxycyclohexanecarboxyl-CoA dehydrogenase [Thermus sp. 2.9]